MKLVVNRCYGGFSLSPLAVKRLAELQGKPCYFFVRKSGDISKNHPVPIEEVNGFSFWSAYTVPNPDEVLKSDDDWAAMSLKEKQAQNKRYDEIHHDVRPEDRADSLLIQVVEELGVEADGVGAQLEIVEIPDGVDWELSEYDGFETIHEKHRSW